MNTACILPDYIGESQSKREGGKKCFPSRESGRRSCSSRIRIENFQIEARRFSRVRPFSSFPEKFITAAAHFCQTEICFFRHRIEKRT